MNNNKILIIGSGLSGLLNGYILSREGLEVTILEKEPRPGGNLQTFRVKNHEFETGVHYVGSLGPGQILNRYWNYFGLSNRIRIQKLDQEGFDHILIGEELFRHAQGFDNFTAGLEARFPRSQSDLKRYVHTLMETASAFPMYNLELPSGHREEPYLHRSARQFLESFNNRTVAGDHPVPLGSALAGSNFLYGGSPIAPLHVSALIHHSFITGVWRFTGGSRQIATILSDQIQSYGGKICTSCEVISIERKNGDFMVKTKTGEVAQAPILISSLHPAVTLSLLAPELCRSSYRQRIESATGTVASFILFLGMKPGVFPYFNHNVYYHKGPDIWNEPGLSGNDWPGMFLLSMSCTSEDQKFADGVTLMTYMNYEEVKQWEHTRSGNRGQDYLDFKEERTQRLLQFAGKAFPGLLPAIDYMTASTPLTYRDYTGIPEGSLYGIAKDFNRPEVTSIMARTKVPGLYFTGQNTNLHGLLGVTIGSVLTAGEIIGLGYLLGKIRNC
jgi:all-trans-retinol 13,14-reductase